MKFLILLGLHISVACLILAIMSGFTMLVGYLIEVICYGRKNNQKRY